MKRRHKVMLGLSPFAVAILVLGVLRFVFGNGVLWHFVR